ncbi:unnamed protein product [Protopolystoma xenopodis]|uniref:Uncharacterized protein n=1 Tax=Protopolystoma xenopodis TaxID=117903 RepID=A0A448WMY4_9PLAT|nr:unnamed protein product [Protopolystoma xenopodis]
MEKAEVLPALPNTNSGTVAAGIQNILICAEMLAAAVGFRFAFPYTMYALGSIQPGTGLINDLSNLYGRGVFKIFRRGGPEYNDGKLL